MTGKILNTPEDRAAYIEDEVKRYYMDKVATRLGYLERGQANIFERMDRYGEEFDSHNEHLDADDKRLNQLKWIVVMFTIWLSVLTCLVVWGWLR